MRAYDVERVTRDRRLVTDFLRMSMSLPTVHGLIEIDLTEARRRIRQMERPPGAGEPSFTAFVIASLARAVAEHPELNARRAGSRLIRFRGVDVGLTIERTVHGKAIPLPYVVEDADRKTYGDISDEVRAAQHRPVSSPGDLVGMAWLSRVPSILRRLLVRIATHVPAAMARLGPPVVVTAIGMFGQGSGWGIPISSLTLTVCVGGIGRRLVLVDGEPVERDMLSLTMTFDHAVVDGAPAARFTRRFVDLLETAAVLGDHREERSPRERTHRPLRSRSPR